MFAGGPVMPRDLILGTAGHIDHGKTSLVKALTGIDTDRLPEEKARGITIDIGFARLDLGDYRLGIVDVPGHERFVKNMLAGATGVDLALLVVAADDSVMPQTREHLEILRLLGLRHGVIALTKCDLVDDTTRDVAAIEIRELVRGTFLADAPIVPTAATAGRGMDELRAAIGEACRTVEERRGAEWFRLAVDRSCVVQGHRTLVTGSVTSG
jgi:selenocysteine-specific elongation factor